MYNVLQCGPKQNWGARDAILHLHSNPVHAKEKPHYLLLPTASPYEKKLVQSSFVCCCKLQAMLISTCTSFRVPGCTPNRSTETGGADVSRNTAPHTYEAAQTHHKPQTTNKKTTSKAKEHRDRC
mmetsp:Transcript_19440/g.31065  ORF Transcript_19440/g.31065 Transcript_19440/m.31065 type:complete len:125 (+) Transcript_19440:737-1111(+)